VLGRSAGSWSVPWDDRISRTHARFWLQSGRLQVDRLPGTLNPIFLRGAATDHFEISIGGHFVIGSTAFTLVEQQLALTLDDPAPMTEETLAPGFLQRLRFHDADHRIDVLSRLSRQLASAVSDEAQLDALVQILLEGMPAASFVAVVALRCTGGEISLLHWDQREDARDTPAPSARLIRQAVASHSSVIHIWQPVGRPADSFTQHDGADWAFCLPLRQPGAATWCVYASGRQLDLAVTLTPALLQEDVKFADIAASSLGYLRVSQRLERQRATLSQFISPVVMETLATDDPEVVLAPRPAQLAVLFCDLRGFSRRAEQEAGDLLGLLQRVSEALGVMTGQILAQGGVVGDFHGDAAMGFWGWPIDRADAPLQACRAALRIRAEFARAAQTPAHPLADFRVGIGIASGPAVAGKIGTTDQVKITAFGPVVNLAARLESMTKLLHAPILLDEATACQARRELAPVTGRLRRVARVLPAGLETALEVSELLPPASEFPALPDAAIAAYEAALDALIGRDWEQAFALLHQVPAEDRVKDFLTIFVAQNNRTPPPGWNGVIAIRRE